MNTINFNQGINLVCFNKNDTFIKILDSVKYKISTISSLHNNEIKSSVFINIGANRLLIGDLQNINFNYAYYVTCTEAFTISYTKSYVTSAKIQLYQGNNLLGFSNTKNIDINKVLDYPVINTISSLNGNIINASININSNFIGDISILEENIGYIINSSDSVTIDIYKNDKVNMSVQYIKSNEHDNITLEIYKTDAKMDNNTVISNPTRNLYISQVLDSSVYNFEVPHGIYNITFMNDCDHSECGTNYGNYKITVGNSIVVNQNNYTKENTTSIFTRYDSTFIHSSLTYEDYVVNMEDKMKNIHGLFPNITKYYSIGKSQDGNYDMWVMEVSGDLSKTTNKPFVRYIGNMHGNEPSGRALIIWFIEWLCDEYYEGNSRVVKLLNNTTIQFLPTLNPWGFHQSDRKRHNSRSYDLNRNFPDQYITTASNAYEAETNNIMNWNANNRQVILSANFHEGAKIISYPFDGDQTMISGITGTPNITPDNKMYIYLSKKYSQNMNPKLNLINSYPSKEFGIINGADWYTLYGGMQDWEYNTYDIMSTTIELSINKNNDDTILDNLKYENLSTDGKNIDGGGMLAYLETAFQGIHGHIYDINGLPIEDATIEIYQNGIEYGTPIKSKQMGDFYKMLPYGSYIITIEKTGYDNYVNGIFINEINDDISQVTQITATLVIS
jgi:hypothetical protein